MPEPLQVKRVIDGDSLELQNGREIRYVGIDTPEWDQPGGKKARHFNRKLLKKAKPQSRYFQRCLLEEKDRYGRILAFVRVDGIDLNQELLRRGLALPMVIPPCGRIRIEPYQKVAAKAREEQKGLWQEILQEIIPHEKAGLYLKQYRGVRGVVRHVHKGPKALHLNFGKNWRRDFTITIFRRDWPLFEARGIDPKKFYKGREVTVFGFIQEYNGPQIIVYSPEMVTVTN